MGRLYLPFMRHETYMSNKELLDYYLAQCAVGKYNCLTPAQSAQIRGYHRERWTRLQQMDFEGKLMANRVYRTARVVIGDHGPYMEFSEADLVCELETAKGQEYRTRPPYSDNVKYLWLTPKGGNLKVYKQLKTVGYAPYQVGCYYVCPFELMEFLK